MKHIQQTIFNHLSPLACCKQEEIDTMLRLREDLRLSNERLEILCRDLNKEFRVEVSTADVARCFDVYDVINLYELHIKQKKTWNQSSSPSSSLMFYFL